jgi:mannose-6-phosphate isomerase-like protein (cupin superfamily)
MPFQGNIFQATEQNANFRKVIFTGAKSQLVVMDIPPGDDVGEEVHEHVEQTLFFLSGEGKAVLNGVETPVVAGDAVVVTPGTKHNFINTGDVSLKIFTVYDPPNHLEGRVHATHADANADEADENFGHSVE